MMGFIQKSLVARLVSTYLVFSLLGVAGMGAASYLVGRAFLRQAAVDRLQSASRQKETDLGLWIEERLRDLQFVGATVARQYAGKAGLDERETQRLLSHLRDYMAAQADVREVLVLAPTGGRVLLSTDPAQVGGYRASYNYYTQGRQGATVQSVYPSPESLRPTITVSMPLKDESGELLGVLAVHLGLERIDQIIRSRAGLGETGETYLVDSSNTLVASGRKGLLHSGRQAHTEGIERALAGGSGHGQYLNDAGVPVVGVYRWLAPYQMALLAEMSQDEAFASAGRLALVSVLVGLAVAALLCLGVYVFSRRMARPILSVTKAAMAVAGGDLSARAPVATRDELGNLAKAFNAMTNDLSNLYSRLELEGRERGAILQSSFDGIALAEKSGELVFNNPGMQRLFGYSVSEVPSLAALADRIFPAPEDRQSFVVNLMNDMLQENPPERVFAFLHRDGGQCWCRMRVSRMPGGRVVINAQDVSALKASEERVRHMALHDSLTGLPNRQLFADRLEQALRRARRNNSGVGLLYIDLDHFKALNDAHGHAHGDRVLVETALRLKACVRESDTVARLGGDEFVIVLSDLPGAADAKAVAEKVLDTLHDPDAAGGNMFLGASVGVACYPVNGEDQDSLLSKADAAMYAAKRAGGNAYRMAGTPS
ncbi:MAG: diguanylate cyclase [Humidesulfovibrio sp.]|uniref:diguanylate cyclase domain-containing protein n=1 Tax=Humidesulfovibrio sp. TaxID=2910988 RepID=UPI0027F7F17D|nr:diguanylate cyclase [Humidesulfovibrio sp.]MDQ7835252.1 diguanylate cyclase [Humidesulfovibrio sp.]